MNYELEKIKYIGSKASLRLEQWHDKWGHWRGGVDWFSEENFKFICEKPTLEEVLECILENQAEWDSPRPKP